MRIGFHWQALGKRPTRPAEGLSSADDTKYQQAVQKERLGLKHDPKPGCEKVLDGPEYSAGNSENALGSRVGQNELRQEARQETQGYSPTAPGGCAELASHSQKFVDDEHYRPAGKRKEKNREEF